VGGRDPKHRRVRSGERGEMLAHRIGQLPPAVLHRGHRQPPGEPALQKGGLARDLGQQLTIEQRRAGDPREHGAVAVGG
jgi:hypothetical protein